MSSRRLARRIALGVGASALVAMGLFTASCGKQGQPAPSTTTTTTTTTTTPPPPPPPSPTEKSINPTGGNLFTPTPIPIEPAPSQNPHRRGSPVG